MHKQESKVDLGKALDVGLVVTESSGVELGKQNTSSRIGNDTDVDNAYIRPIYDEELMAEHEVSSRAKIQSHKTRNDNKPVDQKSHTQKPVRQIFTGHKFSPNKSSVVYEKTSHRSCLSKVESEPPHGSNVDISKIHACKQTLDLSAGSWYMSWKKNDKKYTEDLRLNEGKNKFKGIFS
ncbi:hypothetical protein Tco_0324048 [Tanacetum coccineum]